MFKAKPVVNEIELSRDYEFSYENFVIATQGTVYLFLEKSGSTVLGLKFDSRLVKYGSPNDEARGGHSLAKYGLGYYGLYQVQNSPWIKEQIETNKVHPRHSDDLFEGLKHFIACFKDVMLEVTSKSYSEFRMSQEELNALVLEQVANLEQ